MILPLEKMCSHGARGYLQPKIRALLSRTANIYLVNRQPHGRSFATMLTGLHGLGVLRIAQDLLTKTGLSLMRIFITLTFPSAHF